MTKLKSLEEHNKLTYEAYTQAVKYPKPNGLACPLCGSELMDSNPSILTSYPPKKDVKCSKCVWSGYRYA